MYRTFGWDIICPNIKKMWKEKLKIKQRSDIQQQPSHRGSQSSLTVYFRSILLKIGIPCAFSSLMNARESGVLSYLKSYHMKELLMP